MFGFFWFSYSNAAKRNAFHRSSEISGIDMTCIPQYIFRCLTIKSATPKNLRIEIIILVFSSVPYAKYVEHDKYHERTTRRITRTVAGAKNGNDS